MSRKARTARNDRRRVSSPRNGRKGGRPRKKRYLEDFAQLGPPPEAPLALARWIQRALALDLHRQMTGRADVEHSRSLRATALAASKMIPLDVLYEAQRLVLGDAREMDAEAGPETEELPEGGELVGPARR